MRARVAVAAVVLCSAAGAAAGTRPVPPRITTLKKLHLQTALVADGTASACIVVPASGAYDDLAKRLADAVKHHTGVALPVVTDRSPQAVLPLQGNRVALGNRSTNPLIAALYDRYHTLLDLRYPGPGGHVVRTVHNPFGGGHNVVLVGGSDRVGVERATDALLTRLREAAKGKALSLGRLADIRLGKGITPPRDVRDARIWEASAGYKSVGYFGWNSLTKRMALYHMTGDPFHAREFLRLAFPDAKARREIAAIDGERIEDKDHPLSGPYHYNAHLMILFWDLIEESPVFSDADRLRVTNAFAQQLNHWTGEWAYAGRSTTPPRAVGSRHGQWAAISLYCLGRYFRTHYPDPVWTRCVEAGVRHFDSLHRYAWVGGESDNLFWYNTGIAPILTYMVLTGDRVPLDNGVLATLLRGQEALISGRRPDWALNSASLGFLHKAAYLTHDGRWLAYRDRTGVDTSVFRLGQSFWPEERLKPQPPADLAGKWTIHRLPKGKWEARRSGLPHEESFEFGSFRSRADAGGDFVLLDGLNGASRNPYHTLAILELRVAGHTLLKGYLNQAIARVDGLMEPRIPMDAALKHSDVLGQTAVAVAEVPNAPFARWRRTLIQRVGRHALIVDELTFRKESTSAEVAIEWETARGASRLAEGRVGFRVASTGSKAGPWGQICTLGPGHITGHGRRWTFHWLGPVAKGERKTFFSFVGLTQGSAMPQMAGLLGKDAAASLANGQELVAALEASAAAPPTEATRENTEPTVPALQPRGVARLASPITDMEVLPAKGGPVLAVAAGKAIHVLTPDGRETKTLATDGPIRMLRWWPEARLLLAGCADEKVIAFDEAGKRRWTFVSEMDPAVFRAAKTYWFKSAPGHEGIHGLHTGAFIGGKSQAFVGSACTLEILDEKGQLVRRMPQFWGKVSTFAFVDGPQGTRNLLAARKYNGTNTVAIINSKTLNPSPRGFISVPRGHTYVSGWSSMNRHHLFVDDLDGDGQKEVVSEINGTWNRVVVWTADGKPKHAANFGPGRRIPARTMRDLDVCDLDGDGRKEIVAATVYGMVVALDSQCGKVWAARLPSPANVLACVLPKGRKEARVVLGCDDGGVRVLNHEGRLVRRAQLKGRPVAIRRLRDGGVAIGTEKGQVAVFSPVE